MNITKVLLFFTVFVVFSACAKPPEEEMGKARDAVARAEADADVKTYAPQSLALARDSLNKMEEAAGRKAYDQAKQLALETVTLADKAITDGRNALNRERQEAQNAIALMLDEIQSTEETIENARSSKRDGINFKEIDADFESAKADGEDAQTANNERRYREARDGAINVRARLSDITSRIGQSTLARSRKK